MESHVLKRQSNNKRAGRQAGPLATVQFRRPPRSYTLSHKYHAKPNTHNCENIIAVAAAGFLIARRANSTSPAEGEQLTLAKLG